MHLKFQTRLDNGISDYGVHERGNTISSCFDVRICISRIFRFLFFLFTCWAHLNWLLVFVTDNLLRRLVY